MIRVFPYRNKWTPIDSLAFIGDPPLVDMPKEQPVRVSCTFTWDRDEALRLGRSWSRFYQDVLVGGPAFGDTGDEFVPGRFIKEGVTITSRGCPYSCPWCLVPVREGDIRELTIKPGNIVQDNNLLACSKEHILKVFKMLSTQSQVVFPGGLDAKLFRKWHVERLKDLSIKEMWFSCDTLDNVSLIEKVANMLSDFSINKKRCYCLIGFNGESLSSAEIRLKQVFELGFLPFAQLYMPITAMTPKHYSKVWRDLARKWSRPAAYRQRQQSTVDVKKKKG